MNAKVIAYSAIGTILLIVLGGVMKIALAWLFKVIIFLVLIGAAVFILKKIFGSSNKEGAA